MPLKRIRSRLGGLLFEDRLGVETTGVIEAETLGHPGDGFGFYQPSQWRTLQRVLPRRSVTEDDVFLDLGSGMGRMVVRAARYPFRRVIGVELSEELHEIAQRNLDAVRDRLVCSDVRLIQGDARTYSVPDDVSFVYLYNPFQGEIFGSAMQSVLRSADRNPRRIRVIYHNPLEHDQLLAMGRFRPTGRRQRGDRIGRPGGVVTRTYEVVYPD